MELCKSCGCQVEDGLKFCRQCGQPISPSESKDPFALSNLGIEPIENILAKLNGDSLLEFSFGLDLGEGTSVLGDIASNRGDFSIGLNEVKSSLDFGNLDISLPDMSEKATAVALKFPETPNIASSLEDSKQAVSEANKPSPEIKSSVERNNVAKTAVKAEKDTKAGSEDKPESIVKGISVVLDSTLRNINSQYKNLRNVQEQLEIFWEAEGDNLPASREAEILSMLNKAGNLQADFVSAAKDVRELIAAFTAQALNKAPVEERRTPEQWLAAAKQALEQAEQLKNRTLELRNWWTYNKPNLPQKTASSLSNVKLEAVGEKPVESNLSLSVLCTLFCCPIFGSVAIVLSMMSAAAAKRGDKALALKYGHIAGILNAISMILGIIGLVVIISCD